MFSGKLPTWAVNWCSTIMAPNTCHELIEKARAYPSWKAQNLPNMKPWLFPEQNTLPPLNLNDVMSSPDIAFQILNETGARKRPQSCQ